MKKLIGVIIIMFTLVITVIYRQLTAKPAREKAARAPITASLREGMALSCVLLQ